MGYLASWDRNGRERNYGVYVRGSFAFYSLTAERILNLGRRVVKLRRLAAVSEPERSESEWEAAKPAPSEAEGKS